MRSRRDQISESYPETFEWIFQTKSTVAGEPVCDFHSWLSHGRGLYWISGKPASGKSTLMNFIAEHREFKTALKGWVGSDLLVVPTFFFWYKGTPEQRSLHGLIRSLLHQLISEHPPFAQLVEPSHNDWTLKQLRAALKAFTDHSRHEKVKICLVVDGLDEFEGQGGMSDQAPLLDLVQGLVQNHQIKAIVSSRPEPLFLDRLSSHPHMRLQDLNRKDIETFVQGRLLQEPSARQYTVRLPFVSILKNSENYFNSCVLCKPASGKLF